MTETNIKDMQDNSDVDAPSTDNPDSPDMPDTDAPAADNSDSADTTDETPDFGEFAQMVTDYRNADRKGKADLRVKVDNALDAAQSAVSDAIDAEDYETAKTHATVAKQAKAAYAAMVTRVNIDREPVNWGQVIANRVATLRAAANRLETAKPGTCNIPADADIPDDLPKGVVADDRVEKLISAGLGPIGTKAPKHDTRDHIAEVVRNAGHWLSVAQIAATASDAYDGGKAGNGAIFAALVRNDGQGDPKLAELGVRPRKGSNGTGDPKMGAEPIPGWKDNSDSADNSDVTADDADNSDSSDADADGADNSDTSSESPKPGPTGRKGRRGAK